MFRRSLLSLQMIVQQFRRAGMPWLWGRSKQEWRTPTTALGRLIYSARHILTRPAQPSQRRSSAPETIVFAFYDLGQMPVTFDVLWFLVGADAARRRAGLESVHVVIVPGPEEGLRSEDRDYDEALPPAARKARIRNILAAACPLLPCLSGLTIASSREQAALLVEGAGGRVFPPHYRTDMPRRSKVKDQLFLHRAEGMDMAVLRALESDLAIVDRFIARIGKGRKIVTITLRDYGYMPARNSNLGAWAEFARSLDPARYAVVFIRDTDRCFETPPIEVVDFAMFDAASVNLGLRMAIYERAYINLGVNNGPMCLCWLNANACYITFKILTAGVPQTTVEYMKFLGFDIGASLPFGGPAQKWVWEDDDADTIKREFAAMSDIVDGDGNRTNRSGAENLY